MDIFLGMFLLLLFVCFVVVFWGLLHLLFVGVGLGFASDPPPQTPTPKVAM